MQVWAAFTGVQVNMNATFLINVLIVHDFLNLSVKFLCPWNNFFLHLMSRLQNSYSAAFVGDSAFLKIFVKSFNAWKCTKGYGNDSSWGWTWPSSSTFQVKKPPQTHLTPTLHLCIKPWWIKPNPDLHFMFLTQISITLKK